ncbi:11294_t:CDS:1 [Ambispora gerdemannii]|uniref:11294_t:CDS:1 n=1 Tax=Ambispora gerdemannii TaxID=144530 RepID=A0A9N8WCQ1_9GLOM|nr:11294_t:CDS:1 [Ambispora gerdemannii]
MKNLTLILVFIIVTFVTFGNIAFAIAPLKWKREKDILHRRIVAEKTIVRKSSLVARDPVCLIGYFRCSISNGCCAVGETCLPGGPPYKCSSDCSTNDIACGDDTCCSIDQICTSDGYCKSQRTLRPD